MLLRRFYISLFIALVLFTFFLSPFVAPRIVHGLVLPNNPITVTSRTFSENFPDYIDLSANAHDAAGTINKASITLAFSAGGQEVHTVPLNKPGNVISVTWREDTNGRYFIPPGTQVYYFWKFWDSAGNMLIDAQQKFSTIDTRFTWQHLTNGLLQVNWYGRPQDFGQFVLGKANANIQSISNNLGGGLIQPINLWIYTTDQAFHGSLAPGSYEWVGGEALPALHEASIVVADTADDTLVRDMPHELTHLVFHQLIAQGITAPTWFDEGLAVYNQTFREAELQARWEKALALQSLLRLSQISDNFPADADKAYLAYAQSYYLLDYMYHTFGKPRMVQLVKLMNDPLTTFDQDLQKALGVDQLHLENQWRLSQGQPAVLTTDKETQMPQPVIQVKQAQNVSTNYTTFWLLIGLGILLVLVSLISLIVLVIYSVRHNSAINEKAHAPASTNWQQGNQAFTYPYSDPSTYMQTSRYTQPPSQPVSPYQRSEYPSKTPRGQAPQE
jgi:hypothetical protein